MKHGDKEGLCTWLKKKYVRQDKPTRYNMKPSCLKFQVTYPKTIFPTLATFISCYKVKSKKLGKGMIKEGTIRANVNLK